MQNKAKKKIKRKNYKNNRKTTIKKLQKRNRQAYDVNIIP